MTLRRRLLTACVLGLVAVLSSLGCSRSKEAEQGVTLAAAASLRVVLPDLIAGYTAKHRGAQIAASYGASGDLRKQVESGAPLDGVLFASAKPVDDLIKSGRVDESTRKVVATNQLVLIGPKGAKPLTFATLTSIPPGEKLAIGDPGAVPAGQYARDILQKKGVWDALHDRLVLGGDVAGVLAYARRGEVAAAIVYRTDALGIEDVVVLDEAKGDWAPRAEIVVGAVKGARAEAGARAFLEFLSSPEAQKLFADRGFGPP